VLESLPAGWKRRACDRKSASGIMNASLSTNVPVIFSVLTTDTIEQALERADAILAAVETANLLAKLGE
jgi:6,7-dimethyl-8-ribityllumazine synthase